MTALVLNPTLGQTLTADRRDTVVESGRLHTVLVQVARDWVDLSIGSTAGAENFQPRVRLDPGLHLFSFTPQADDIWFRATADEPGVRSIVSISYVTTGLITLPTPYLAGDLRRLRFEQSGDVLWVWHPELAWRAIARRSNRSWSLYEWRPRDGPFLSPNVDDAHTLQASGRVGEVEITSNRDVFVPGHIGALWQMEHVGQFVTAGLSTAGQASDSIRVTGVGTGRAFAVTVSGSFTGPVRLERSVGNTLDWRDVTTYAAPTTSTVNDGFDNQIIFYRLAVAAGATFTGTATVTLTFSAGATVGRVRITEVRSARSARADVLRTLGATTPTAVWAEGAWSAARGYPAAGALHDGRLWLVAGRSLWASRPDDFLSFETGPNDDDAISRVIAIGDVSPAVWIKGAAHLLIGTESSEAAVRSTSFEEPLTPTNMTIRERSVRGSANVDAVRMGNQVFFVSRSGRRLIRLSYNVDSQGYEDGDLTRLHEEVSGSGGFVGLELQIEPEPRLWLVRADGQVAILTYNQNENVVGWSRFVAADGGKILDVGILPGRPEDSVYIAVGGREVSGEDRIVLERLQPERWERLEDAWRLQSALDYSGAPVRTLTGLRHLNGVMAHVWADGQEHRPVLVDAGQITLDRPVRRAIVGRQQVARYQSPRLAHGSQLGTSVGEIKRVNAATVLTSRTPRHAIRVGANFERMTQLSDQASPVLDAAPPARTEEVRYEIQSGHSTDARVCIEMVGSGPALVLGYVPDVQTNERNT